MRTRVTSKSRTEFDSFHSGAGAKSMSIPRAVPPTTSHSPPRLGTRTVSARGSHGEIFPTTITKLQEASRARRNAARYLAEDLVASRQGGGRTIGVMKMYLGMCDTLVSFGKTDRSSNFSADVRLTRELETRDSLALSISLVAWPELITYTI